MAGYVAGYPTPAVDIPAIPVVISQVGDVSVDVIFPTWTASKDLQARDRCPINAVLHRWILHGSRCCSSFLQPLLLSGAAIENPRNVTNVTQAHLIQDDQHGPSLDWPVV